MRAGSINSALNDWIEIRKCRSMRFTIADASRTRIALRMTIRPQLKKIPRQLLRLTTGIAALLTLPHHLLLD
jgi:hypothetical protein